jgi:hypothetical protein
MSFFVTPPRMERTLVEPAHRENRMQCFIMKRESFDQRYPNARLDFVLLPFVRAPGDAWA